MGRMKSKREINKETEKKGILFRVDNLSVQLNFDFPISCPSN